MNSQDSLDYQEKLDNISNIIGQADQIEDVITTVSEGGAELVRAQK